MATTLLDPELIMAARRGDSKWLEKLLPNGQEEQAAAGRVAPAQQVDGGAAASAAALDGVTPNDGDSLLHVVAACGDNEEFRYCAKMIYRGKRDLLVKQNSNDETPLHCAAGAGNANMTFDLVALAPPAEVNKLLRMPNKCGETALHKAVIAADTACIDVLMSPDPELGCFPHEAISPLYLAISLGHKGIIQQLFEKSGGKLSYSGPEGRNVLHAAVSRIEVLEVLLKQLSVDDLLHLTKQGDKQTGSTPLHLAASLAGWPFLKHLSRWFPPFYPGSKTATRLLLDAVPGDRCSSSLYQPDKEGLYPIHVAAMSGSRAVVKILLQRSPDCATLRDSKGRTFLHVAVEEEKDSVVKYACRFKSPECSSFVNLQDHNGDTALHRAVDVGNLAIFNHLIKNKDVRLDVSNKKAIKPHDLSWSKIHPGLYYMSMHSRCIIRTSLSLLAATFGESRPDIFWREHKDKKFSKQKKRIKDEHKDKKQDLPSSINDKEFSKQEKRRKLEEHEQMKDLTSTAQAASVVAALVATAAYASAFTVPGGYRADGTPVLAGSYGFDVFVISIAVAFVCACAASCSLVFAGVSAMDRVNRVWYMKLAENLLLNAVRSFGTAFCWGLLVTLYPVARATALMTTIMLWVCLLYGNMEGRQILFLAKTARARKMGIPISAHVLVFFRFFGRHYYGKMIAYGLPAIPRIIKLLHNKLS